MIENRGNTKMCSVLFVDIVGYSKKTNIEQMALKERFVSLWGAAIKDVPPKDIMVVDAGDGAAMTALVEQEDTIRVALKLRELLSAEEKLSGELLPLRMGINFGPVQLSTDVHGNDCVVGDAINTAQRIMSFADPGQVMLSRSYYDIILPLAHKYKEMFYYLGKRADKHIRHHDVYGLGAPNQSASLGHAAAEDLVHIHDVEIEEIKEKLKQGIHDNQSNNTPTQTNDQATPVTPPAEQAIRTLPGGILKWFTSIFSTLFFLIKIGLLCVLIYELVMIGPIINQPDQVKTEIDNQAKTLKNAILGVRSLKEAIAPQINELGHQLTAPVKK